MKAAYRNPLQTIVFLFNLLSHNPVWVCSHAAGRLLARGFGVTAVPG